MSDVAREIEAIATEADATMDAPMPADATPTRPNKSVVMAVRLTPDDARAVEEIADRTGVPAAALLRTWITAGLSETRTESLASAVERLSADVALLRHLVA